MEAGGKIYQAIPAIMGEINAIGKNKRNTSQGFMYRGIDDVMNAINPALVKNKVFIVPEIMDQMREERKSNKGANLIYSICRIRFKFFAEDGSSVEAVTIGEGMDSGDKATNKAMAIAFKYACFQIFCIRTVEMKDPDAEYHDVQPKENGANQSSGGKNQAERRNSASQRASDSQDKSEGQRVSDEQANKEMAEQAGREKIDATKAKVLRDMIKRKGLSTSSIVAHYKVETIEDMTIAHWTNAMELLKRYPDREGGK